MIGPTGGNSVYRHGRTPTSMSSSSVAAMVQRKPDVAVSLLCCHCRQSFRMNPNMISSAATTCRDAAAPSSLGNASPLLSSRFANGNKEGISLIDIEKAEERHRYRQRLRKALIKQHPEEDDETKTAVGDNAFSSSKLTAGSFLTAAGGYGPLQASYFSPCGRQKSECVSALQCSDDVHRKDDASNNFYTEGADEENLQRWYTAYNSAYPQCVSQRSVRWIQQLPSLYADHASMMSSADRQKRSDEAWHVLLSDEAGQKQSRVLGEDIPISSLVISGSSIMEYTTKNATVFAPTTDQARASPLVNGDGDVTPAAIPSTPEKSNELKNGGMRESDKPSEAAQLIHKGQHMLMLASEHSWRHRRLAESSSLTSSLPQSSRDMGSSMMPLCPRCWRRVQLPQMKRNVLHVAQDALAVQSCYPPQAASLAACFDVSNSGKGSTAVRTSTPELSLDTIASSIFDHTAMLSHNGISYTTPDPQESRGGAPLFLPCEALSEVDSGDIHQLQAQISSMEEEVRRTTQEVQETREVLRAMHLKERENAADWSERARAENIFQAGPRHVSQEEAACRRKAIATLTCSLHDMEQTPMLAIIFPIRVDDGDPFGRICGLRLGLAGQHATTSMNPGTSHHPEQRSKNSSLVRHPGMQGGSSKRKTGQISKEHQLSVQLGALLREEERQAVYASAMLSGVSEASNVSCMELNTSCGYLLHLLQQLAEMNSYVFRSAILHPRADRSTIDVLETQATTSTPAKKKCVDFFLTDSYFFTLWKTFPTGCAAVLQCVQELCETLSVSLQCAMRRQQMSLHGTLSRQSSNSVTATPVASERAFGSPLMHGEGIGGGGGADTPSIVPETLQRVIETLIVPTNSFSQPGAAATTEGECGKTDISFTPIPYAISHDKIDGFSIVHGSVSDAVWTVAMKKMLANVQWCVWASAQLQATSS